MSHNHLAEKKLAGLIALELGIVVPDDALGPFIRANWARIAPLAHLIHEAPDTTKPNPGMTQFSTDPMFYTDPVPNSDPAVDKDHTYLRNLAERIRPFVERDATQMLFSLADMRRLHKIADKVTS